MVYLRIPFHNNWQYIFNFIEYVRCPPIEKQGKIRIMRMDMVSLCSTKAPSEIRDISVSRTYDYVEWHTRKCQPALGSSAVNQHISHWQRLIHTLSLYPRWSFHIHYYFYSTNEAMGSWHRMLKRASWVSVYAKQPMLDTWRPYRSHIGLTDFLFPSSLGIWILNSR